MNNNKNKSYTLLCVLKCEVSAIYNSPNIIQATATVYLQDSVIKTTAHLITTSLLSSASSSTSMTSSYSSAALSNPTLKPPQPRTCSSSFLMASLIAIVLWYLNVDELSPGNSTRKICSVFSKHRYTCVNFK